MLQKLPVNKKDTVLKTKRTETTNALRKLRPLRKRVKDVRSWPEYLKNGDVSNDASTAALAPFSCFSVPSSCVA